MKISFNKATDERAFPTDFNRDINVPPTSHTAYFNDFRVIIEQPIGSQRSWTDVATGEKGVTTFLNPYGYFAESKGHDKEEVDCYLGPDELAEYAYVVKQLRIDTGKYDESKIMLGFSNALDAETAYKKHYNKPGFFGGMTVWPVAKLRIALKQSKYNPNIIKALLRYSK